MNEDILLSTTIAQYGDMLKTGSDPEKVKQIDELINSKILDLSDGFDMHLFQLNKDYLLILHKWLLAMLESDDEKMLRYSERAAELLKHIKIKEALNERGTNDTPYVSFLKWLLSLKKYYGSGIDKSGDLLELISATEQMLKFFHEQEKQINQNKVK